MIVSIKGISGTTSLFSTLAFYSSILLLQQHRLIIQERRKDSALVVFHHVLLSQFISITCIDTRKYTKAIRFIAISWNKEGTHTTHA